MLTALLATGVLLAVVVGVFLDRERRLRQELADAQVEAEAVRKEIAPLRRQVQHLEAEHRFLTGFLTELPHLTRELHSGINERRIPGVLLNIVSRILEPKHTLVLLRRRRSLPDGARETRLVVAECAPADGPVARGTEIETGEGELGFAAEVQRTLTRHEMDGQTRVTRERLKAETPPGFAPDVVAPMIFGEETVGLLAITGPTSQVPDAKAVLRLIAQIGALALHDVTAYTDMKATADLDGLTMVFNKRHMTTALAEMIVKAQREISCLSVFLFDIDHFKHYNDTNGHVAGDKLLQLLARFVVENTRRENVFGRFGGEEFLLIFPGVRSGEALVAADKIRERIAGHGFPFAERQPLGMLSVSGGVAEYPLDALDSARLLESADQALYAAKHAGRNRALAWAPEYAGGEEPLDPALQAPAAIADEGYDYVDGEEPLPEDGTAATPGGAADPDPKQPKTD